jgi:5-methylcytosine-specific restriction endonuclease McrA
MKQCRKCKRILSIDNFYHKKLGKDGHINHCKECEEIYRKQWRDKFGWAKGREMIRMRDNHTCLICGKKWLTGRRFHVHHIDCDPKKSQQWDNLEIEADNMVTLCPSCHRYLHIFIRQEKRLELST